MCARASGAGPSAASPRSRRCPRPDIHGLPVEAARLHRALGDLVPRARPRVHRAGRRDIRGRPRRVLETGHEPESRADRQRGCRHHRIRSRCRDRRDPRVLGPERVARGCGRAAVSREGRRDRRIVPGRDLGVGAALHRRRSRVSRDRRRLGRADHRRRPYEPGNRVCGRGPRRDRRDRVPRVLVARRAGRRRGREDGPDRRARPRVAAFGRESLADLRNPDPPLHPQPRPLAAHRRHLWRACGEPGRSARPARRHQRGPEPREPRLDDHLGAGRVDRLHRALLRPTSAQRGVRPPARRGGLAAVLRRAVVLSLVLWIAVPSGVALADTLGFDAYLVRLVQVRTLVERSRGVGTADRDRMLAQATTLLRQTTAIQSHGETVPVDDGPIADLLARPNGANAALAILDGYIAMAEPAARTSIDPATADARLRDVLGNAGTAGTSLSGVAALLDWISSRLAAFFSGLRGLPDLRFLPWIVVAFGVGLVLVIVATLGRGIRERVRREVLLPDRALARAVDPVAHRRAAEAALAGGHAREAIHELYLYVLQSLAARELIRYDPALTDHELLLRAAAIPNADALRDLVALYERAWFGLREPDAAEAERARSLATRVAG